MERPLSPLPALFSQSRAKAQVGPIGLEFADEELHMVQLERGAGGAIRPRARALAPYPQSYDEMLADPVAVRALVAKALKQERFQGRRVVTVMPRGATRILPVTYQVREGEQDAAIILDLMASRLQGEVEDYVIDYVPVRSQQRRGDRVALVASIPRKQVDEYLALLDFARLEPVAIEIGPTAIKRLVSRLSEHEASGNDLVVNFGDHRSYLTLISGRRLMFDSRFSVGELTLIQQLAEALETTPAKARELVRRHGLVPTLHTGNSEAAAVAETILEILKPRFLEIVEEISRALVYAASETRGLPVRHVYMLGSLARWSGIDRIFSDLLELPVGVVPDPWMNPERAGHQPGAIGQTPPEMAVATGLALRELEDA